MEAKSNVGAARERAAVLANLLTHACAWPRRPAKWPDCGRPLGLRGTGCSKTDRAPFRRIPPWLRPCSSPWPHAGDAPIQRGAIPGVSRHENNVVHSPRSRVRDRVCRYGLGGDPTSCHRLGFLRTCTADRDGRSVPGSKAQQRGGRALHRRATPRATNGTSWALRKGRSVMAVLRVRREGLERVQRGGGASGRRGMRGRRQGGVGRRREGGHGRVCGWVVGRGWGRGRS
jgi:hypothetical protein